MTAKRKDGFTEVPLPPEQSPENSEEAGSDPEDRELDELDRVAALQERPTTQMPRVRVVENRNVEGMLDLDPSTLDPDFHYKWVNDSPLRVARHRMRGYVPVMAEEGVRTVVDVDTDVDGVLRVGDTILMKCPKERVRQRDENHRRLSESRLAAPKKKFLSEAEKLGVEIVTDRDAGTRRE
jgi:hypothetical protein